MKKEIGSEFNRIPLCNGLGFKFPIPGEFVFSGRTAIETVLKEIPKAKKALLPSYCCYSMIRPFIDRGIEVSFYPVNYRDGLQTELNIDDDIDVIFWCNYFGFYNDMPDLSDFVHNGGLIIEDITHSLLSDISYNKQSNFLVASVRKWEPILCGGYCATKDGILHYVPKSIPPDEYVSQKRLAMEIKTEYLRTPDEDKKKYFLSMFNDCNHWLGENYSNLAIDEWSKEYILSVDIEEQKSIRKRNARVLYDGLKNYVSFLFTEEDMDCPLFVPILVANRNKVRSSLIENQIYCPIHWPKVEGCISNIYDGELSLICDQRYNEADMERIIYVLRTIL